MEKLKSYKVFLQLTQTSKDVFVFKHFFILIIHFSKHTHLIVYLNIHFYYYSYPYLLFIYLFIF